MRLHQQEKKEKRGKSCCVLIENVQAAVIVLGRVGETLSDRNRKEGEGESKGGGSASRARTKKEEGSQPLFGTKSGKRSTSKGKRGKDDKRRGGFRIEKLGPGIILTFNGKDAAMREGGFPLREGSLGAMPLSISSDLSSLNGPKCQELNTL